MLLYRIRRRTDAGYSNLFVPDAKQARTGPVIDALVAAVITTLLRSVVKLS